MGWRDRDYARWTDEERRRFYGSTSGSGDARRTSYPAGPGQGRLFGSRVGVAPGALLAVIVSLLVALLLGQLPRSHPLLPALHFNLTRHGTSPPGATTGVISLPANLTVGSFLTLRGQLPPGETGTVTVEGEYGNSSWQVLATVPATDGSYGARVAVNQRGILHLRVTYPDGRQALGETQVH